MAVQSEYNEQVQKKLQEIISLCYEISTKTKADVFLNYSPHIAAVLISYHPNGWNSEIDDWEYIQVKDSIYIHFGTTNDGYEYGTERLDDAIKQLKASYHQLSEDKPNEP